MGRLDLALDHSQQALQLTVDLHARYLQTRALLGLAATRHKLRQHARAVEDARQALHPEVISGTMFGMPCAKAAGKAFMGSFDGGAVFKLNEPARTQALELPGSALFNPSGNRPMREWVVVRPEHQDHWTALAEAALDKVRAV